jgi:CheY-like chemotaxis protein
MSSSPDLDAPARILVVDDGADNRAVLEVILAWEGFVVLTAASGDEAIAAVALQPPDLILLDVMMPGMDGYEVLDKLKGDLATKNIPVIMVTALKDPSAERHARSAAADDVLAKPLDRIELVSRVRRLLLLKPAATDGAN